MKLFVFLCLSPFLHVWGMQMVEFNEVDAEGVIKWYCLDYISATE